MGRSPFRVAIVGAGPAGSALAILLARQGAQVTLFDHGRRPPLLVGESLVPAIVPILQRLGFEQETAAVGLVKPGVTFVWSPQDRASFRFARFAPAVPPYAYNIPRPQFDEALLARAVASGAHRVVIHARLDRANGPTRELALSPDTLAAAPSLEGRQPDLIVDATGRARQAARALDIPARVGPRDDIAHFAHYQRFSWDDEPGQVVISRIKAGWSWRIPLKDRLSVGIVVDRREAENLGRTAEERLERAIAIDAWLPETLAEATRVSPTATYSNYQLISERGSGPGWVMIGDAFGFVDPMLSPGVFLGLRSAELVADALAPFARGRREPTPEALASALDSYAATQTAMLDAWMELVAFLYDGRLMAMLRAGHGWIGARPSRLRTAAQNHIERQVALQASGVATTSRYGRGLLRLLGRYGLRGVEPAELALH
ncbi:MAG TPA: NAD(P)/FAD-dependent oxidoreductase [Methylomirabilota bacterium]|nr:NAD(P)/FAD-dependent oxidoreductase [Methylomirabilota bacterium]